MGVDLAGNLKDLAGNVLVGGSAFIFSNVFMGVDLAGNLKDLAGNALVRGSAFIFSNLFMALIWRGINAKIEKARPAEKGATRDRLSTKSINIDAYYEYCLIYTRWGGPVLICTYAR